MHMVTVSQSVGVKESDVQHRYGELDEESEQHS